jgi:hypothetical protein
MVDMAFLQLVWQPLIDKTEALWSNNASFHFLYIFVRKQKIVKHRNYILAASPYFRNLISFDPFFV